MMVPELAGKVRSPCVSAFAVERTYESEGSTRCDTHLWLRVVSNGWLRIASAWLIQSTPPGETSHEANRVARAAARCGSRIHVRCDGGRTQRQHHLERHTVELHRAGQPRQR